MPTISTTDGAQIFYKDWGSGQPVVFSHGWPLNADAWDEQLFMFASNGGNSTYNHRAAVSVSACSAISALKNQYLTQRPRSAQRRRKELTVAHPPHKCRRIY